MALGCSLLCLRVETASQLVVFKYGLSDRLIATRNMFSKCY